MLLLENLQELPGLPCGWEWQDVEFLRAHDISFSRDTDSDVDDRGPKIVKRVTQFLEKDLTSMTALWQPRFRYGWHEKALTWMKAVIASDGGEVGDKFRQYRFDPACTILTVETNIGKYFLKGTDPGSGEVDMTACVSKLMPDRTLDVVSVSNELQSVISRELNVMKDCDQSITKKECLRFLGRLQLDSLHHLEKLEAGGFQVRGPRELCNAVDSWIVDEDLFEDQDYLMGVYAKFAPKLKAEIERLQEYSIPLTLTHGDFASRNLGLKKGGDGSQQLVVFDWQFASISHPFFDLREIHEEQNLSEEERRCYLEMWREYEPVERCEELYEIAHRLGWLLKLHGIARANNSKRPELHSEWPSAFGQAVLRMHPHILHDILFK
ncbi:unnamed protein product [Chondrus crispus]|uniref:Aminoglycoside phosphotransferase domain-containing protein n=1 Tax=Chondrus crispus TaxID=2769 RepID=R7Q7G8_CHOCR|nr:unnamed protein product [Chondrus crispus]CDF33331.1 unnamed protein product [Chondrus crispus]|eukprot:XP_005713134.1 unnamed protein product [Chondrus crispus]